MATNKVQLSDGTVIVDLTNNTITPETVVLGAIGTDKKGAQIEGTLVVQKYYTGSTTPSSSLGNNGDIYLKA